MPVWEIVLIILGSLTALYLLLGLVVSVFAARRVNKTFKMVDDQFDQQFDQLKAKTKGI